MGGVAPGSAAHHGASIRQVDATDGRYVLLTPGQEWTVTATVRSLPALRERGPLWDSRPSNWVLASSVVDALIAFVMAILRLAMAPLPVRVVARSRLRAPSRSIWTL